ncbi:hypothetical protein P3566_23955, partial [Vibrio parahaemolyticus]|nr:hypothetical protein [Vibrio parahaemolyticus]
MKHPTDWHTESSQSLYESIHQTAKEALDIKCSAGFVTIEDYRNSPWRDQVMDSFDLFSQFELERADKFSWMQDLQGDLQLSDDKSLWHYWPFVGNHTQSKCFCNRDISKSFLLEVLGGKETIFENSHYDSMRNVSLDELLNSLNDMFRTYEIDDCLNKIHFLSQAFQESDFFKTTEEYYYNGKYPEKWNKYRGGAFYHGRGLLQITHIENYAKYFGVNTKDLTKEMIESVAKDLHTA